MAELSERADSIVVKRYSVLANRPMRGAGDADSITLLAHHTRLVRLTLISTRYRTNVSERIPYAR